MFLQKDLFVFVHRELDGGIFLWQRLMLVLRWNLVQRGFMDVILLGNSLVVKRLWLWSSKMFGRRE